MYQTWPTPIKTNVYKNENLIKKITSKSFIQTIHENIYLIAKAFVRKNSFIIIIIMHTLKLIYKKIIKYLLN